jgi:glycosyltransferase involved in cell wall biosynthesis
VHLWSYRNLLDAVPNKPWLVKHNPQALEKSILSQILWQRFILPHEAKRCFCQIFLNTDAGTISKVRPAVTMSRDMLSYEPGVIELFGFGKARIRLMLLHYVQNRSLRNADGVIFLTRYAADTIQRSCGSLKSISYIPHGVGDIFKRISPISDWPKLGERPLRCLYISNTEVYKHQWVVVAAIALLRSRGYNLRLKLVGGGAGPAQNMLNRAIKTYDPMRNFVEQLEFLPHAELPNHLAQADIFVFASSCENMPNTLVEAMAVGLPIACSNRGPMPEILADGGVYFNPVDTDSIAAAIEQIIISPTLRVAIVERAKNLSQQYNWKRCAEETLAFIVKTLNDCQK